MTKPGDLMAIKFPLAILWPATAIVAVIGEQWTRDRSGQIRAIYNDVDKLRLAIQTTQWLNEGPGPLQQIEMFPRQLSNYALYVLHPKPKPRHSRPQSNVLIATLASALGFVLYDENQALTVPKNVTVEQG